MKCAVECESTLWSLIVSLGVHTGPRPRSGRSATTVRLFPYSIVSYNLKKISYMALIVRISERWRRSHKARAVVEVVCVVITLAVVFLLTL